jgi:tetratricopeptide (TPR) repeat protein
LTLRPSPKLFADTIVAGRYRIVSEVGQGGMSVVYQATDMLENRDVALKLMRLAEDDPRGVLYLQQEFRSMSRLIHPKLVRVFDYGFIERHIPYFTMELLPGQDLSSIGKLPLGSIYHILVSLADALAFIHARGYVHRDVKPSNVRVIATTQDELPDIRLMDCGLTEEQGKFASSVAGTLSYLAPEAWLGAPTDTRGDLYSLGVLAYEITVGQLPFDASTGVRLLKSKTERPKDLRELRPEVPQAFARLVRDLLAPEPANRPASAMEVLARLNQFTVNSVVPDPLAYLRAPSFIGRGKELLRIRRALTEAERGAPVALTIVAPAGAGKTRLFDEALLEAGLRGAFIARSSGRGFAGGAYGIYHDLISHLKKLPKAPEVIRALGGDEVLNPLAKRSTLNPPIDPGDPVYARQLRHERFCRFLSEVAKDRLVLIAIDDLHLADAASLDALASVLYSPVNGNIAILSTLRTGEKHSPSLEHFLDLTQRLELDKMSKDQIGGLIFGAFGPTEPTPELLADLERVTDGNVYFALEILRTLAARGLIEQRRTFIQLPDNLHGIALPQTLSDALKRRVSELSSAALALGRICATIGYLVDLPFARSLFDGSDESFLDAVDELRQAELIELSEQRIRMHHTRVQDVLLDELSQDERTDLHLRVATALEKAPIFEERERTAELGFHFDLAKQPTPALEYLVAAGDSRYDDYAYSDALTVYRRAHELLPFASVTLRPSLERKLNDRLGRISFYHDHQSGPLYLERARKNHLEIGFLGWIEPLGRFLGPSIAVPIALALSALKGVFTKEKLTFHDALGHLIDSFAATTYLANCYTYSGRINRALDSAERLRPLIYSKRRLPQAGYQLSRVYGLVLANRFDEAVAGSLETLSILAFERDAPVTNHDRVHAEGGALITLVWADLSRGYVAHSDYLSRFEAFVAHHPTALLESWLLEVRVFIAFRKGNLDETIAAWELLLHRSSQAEVQFVRNKARVWLGLAYVEAGQASVAQDLADDVTNIARQKNNPMLIAMGLELRGLAHRAWEQFDVADRCFEEACQLLTHPDVGAVEVYHSVLLCRASLALERGQLALARMYATEVETANRTLRLKHDRHRMQVARVIGRVEVAEGHPELGILHINEALELATLQEDRMEQAYCLFSLSLAERTSHPQAAQVARERCEEILLEMGNDYQLRRLGLRGVEDPASSSQNNVLWRVRQLVGTPVENGNPILGDYPSNQFASLPMVPNDETLPAADSELLSDPSQRLPNDTSKD